MPATTFHCPRCAFRARDGREAVKFCPHCGLANDSGHVSDRPMEIQGRSNVYSIGACLGVGEICNIYPCEFSDGRRTVRGVFKIARDARNNHLLRNEASVLGRLHGADVDRKHGPFLPSLEESLNYRASDETESRRANVLVMHPDVRSPSELFSLAEVKSAYPKGLDPRDMAWIWRRLLTILGFAHAQAVVHGAVVPSHVLIGPKDHKLLLIDWCFATIAGSTSNGTFAPMLGPYRHWAPRRVSAPDNSYDIALAARCMIDLMGGDGDGPQYPTGLDPALQRYFERCIGQGMSTPPGDAWKLLDDFDRLIHALWGKRAFRPLVMPDRNA